MERRERVEVASDFLLLFTAFLVGYVFGFGDFTVWLVLWSIVFGALGAGVQLSGRRLRAKRQVAGVAAGDAELGERPQ